MNRIGLALRTFFRILGDRAHAETIRSLTRSKARPSKDTALASNRSEALTLVAALQREARFLDFVMEPLDGFTDAQVGAAARHVHRDAAAVITRCFHPEPLRADAEGARVEVPEHFDPAEFRVTGSAQGAPPYQARLCHHGWKATTCDIPTWRGEPAQARVLAPAEVEVG